MSFHSQAQLGGICPPEEHHVRARWEVCCSRCIAVFNRPEKPNPCKPTVRSACFLRRIACMTRTSLRQRSAFFHLTVDDSRCNLPSFAHSPCDDYLRASLQDGVPDA